MVDITKTLTDVMAKEKCSPIYALFLLSTNTDKKDVIKNGV